jgi:hypothetical protein
MQFSVKRFTLNLNNIQLHKKLVIAVRTQFSKDDVESSDSSGYWIVNNDVDGDEDVWVDLAAK